MNKFVLGVWMLVWGTGIARGGTTDDYYSVQNGDWDQASTWTSQPAAFGYPRAGDRAFVHHHLMVTCFAACAEADVAETVEIGETGRWDVYDRAQFNGAHIQGTGPFKTWGATFFTGMPSQVDCPWSSVGPVTFADTPALQLENTFYIDGTTVEVNVAHFTVASTTGTGRVYNDQGTWRVRPGSTCLVSRYDSQSGIMHMGTGSLFRASGTGSRYADSHWVLEEDSVFEPVTDGQTTYFEGTHVATGEGRWQLRGGLLYLDNLATTTTVFNVGGGGVQWSGGDIEVPPGSELVNQGEFHAAGHVATQGLAGTFVNRGNVWLGTVTGGVGYCRIDGTWRNEACATTTVVHSDFRWRGTGTFENAGMFRVAGIVTTDTGQVHFRNIGGQIDQGPASVLRIRGNQQHHTGGRFYLATGARCQVAYDGADYWDGEYVVSGPGVLRHDNGILMASHDLTTTTTFNATGGGIRWGGGEIWVRPGNPLYNQGEFHVEGHAATQRLAGTFVNRGNVWLGTATSGVGYCQIDGQLVNEAYGTATVVHSDFRWRGTGTFENAGTFRVAGGVTGSTESIRFRLMGGQVGLDTAAAYQIQGNGQQHVGGSFWLETGAVCQVVCGGTDYWDGAYAATGDGALQLNGGTLMASYSSPTTTAFNAAGGGFQLRGGTFNVRPGHWLENRGTMHFASTTTPVVLQGELRNVGRVYYGTSTPCLLTGPGGMIVNAETGVWDFVQAGGTIDVLSDHFYNYGTVNYLAATTRVFARVYNMPGGTTVLHRGTASFAPGMAVYGGRLSLCGGAYGGDVYVLDIDGIGGTLCGTGTVAGYVNQMGGTLAPGHSPGGLSIGDNYTQSSSSTLRIELGGKAPGTAHDQLVVASNVSVKGTLAVELYNGYAPAGGERFDVIRSESLTPTNFFLATNLPALDSGLSWLVLYRTNGVQLRVASAADVDGDGLQDDWETAQFGHIGVSDGGADDFDDDGYADFFEQLLDTQPTNHLDFFQVGEIAVSGSNSLVTLRTGSNAFYAIEARSDLADPVDPWETVDEFGGTGGTLTRTNPAAGVFRAFRLKAAAP